MKQKQNLIILGAIGVIFLLFWLAVIMLVLKLRGSSESAEPPLVVDVTLCDENASDLCIVNFGVNNLNRMVIHFQLPSADYPMFYVKATNRDTVSIYVCEVDETVAEPEPAAATGVATETATEAAPTSVSCKGVRTPLGETIDIEVYTTDGDNLIARGTFLVSAIALPTLISLPSETPIPVATPPPAVSTDAPFVETSPTPDANLP